MTLELQGREEKMIAAQVQRRTHHALPRAQPSRSEP